MDNSILVTPEIEILWNRVNSEREISMLNKKRFLTSIILFSMMGVQNFGQDGQLCGRMVLRPARGGSRREWQSPDCQFTAVSLCGERKASRIVQQYSRSRSPAYQSLFCQNRQDWVICQTDLVDRSSPFVGHEPVEIGIITNLGAFYGSKTALLLSSCHNWRRSTLVRPYFKRS